MGEAAETLGQGEWQEGIEDGPALAGDPVRRDPGAPMALIGLAGLAGTGKDTIADWWIDDHLALRAAFANPLKYGLAFSLGLPIELFFDRDRKEQPVDWLGKSPRELMQLFGTEWGRTHLGEDIWIRVADRMRGGVMDAPEFAHVPALVYTDVRMENEADWIREQGGWIVHVVRPGVDPAAHHASESGVQLKPGDVVIRNVSTLEHLRQVADAVFRSIVETEAFLAEVDDEPTTEEVTSD